MFRFDPKQPGEITSFTWRWNRLMSAGLTISSVAFVVAVAKGTDSPITLATNGSAVITSPDASGNHDTSQQFKAGIAGVVYTITAKATLSDGSILYDTCELSVVNPT
jgi:hypothetical protein